MTVVHITFNSTASSGTATVNGHSSRWTSSEAADGR